MVATRNARAVRANKEGDSVSPLRDGLSPPKRKRRQAKRRSTSNHVDDANGDGGDVAISVKTKATSASANHATLHPRTVNGESSKDDDLLADSEEPAPFRGRVRRRKLHHTSGDQIEQEIISTHEKTASGSAIEIAGKENGSQPAAEQHATKDPMGPRSLLLEFDGQGNTDTTSVKSLTPQNTPRKTLFGDEAQTSQRTAPKSAKRSPPFDEGLSDDSRPNKKSKVDEASASPSTYLTGFKTLFKSVGRYFSPPKVSTPSATEQTPQAKGGEVIVEPSTPTSPVAALSFHPTDPQIPQTPQVQSPSPQRLPESSHPAIAAVAKLASPTPVRAKTEPRPRRSQAEPGSWLSLSRHERGAICKASEKKARETRETLEKLNQEREDLRDEWQYVKTLETALIGPVPPELREKWMARHGRDFAAFEKEQAARRAKNRAHLAERKTAARQWRRDFEKRLREYQEQQGAGTKRKRFRVDDLESIPHGPPGTFQLMEDYFEQGSDEEDYVEHDFDKVKQWQDAEPNEERPTKRTRLEASPAPPAVQSPLNAKPYVGQMFQAFQSVSADPTRATPYTGEMFAEAENAPAMSGGNIFDQAESQEKRRAHQAVDFSSPLTIAKRYHVWTGPKALPAPQSVTANSNGVFQVPDESDSDTDSEASDQSLILAAPPTTLLESSRQTSNGTFVQSQEQGIVMSGALTSNRPLSQQGPELSTTADALPGFSIKGLASKSNVFSTPSKVPSVGLSMPATPSFAQDGEAVARARSQIEKYKPKTPSGLRATSQLSSSPAASTFTEAERLPGEPIMTVEEDSSTGQLFDANQSFNSQNSPPGSPPGLSDNTTDEDDGGDHPKTPIGHTSPTSMAPVRSPPDEHIAEQDFAWPDAQPLPFQLDSAVKNALRAYVNSSQFQSDSRRYFERTVGGVGSGN